MGLNKKLYLLGEGELSNWTAEFIKNNKLENDVLMLGYQKNPYAYIKNSSYIVMTSQAEGFPTIFVEGLALGVGFVSTNVGGVEELSNKGLCGFVSDEDSEIINYLYTELTKEPTDRFIKKEECEKHVANYTTQKQVESLIKLLEELDNEQK